MPSKIPMYQGRVIGHDMKGNNMHRYKVTAVRRHSFTWETEANSSWEAVHIAHDTEEMPENTTESITDGWEVEELNAE